jgi:hypothetical protein
MSRFFVTPDTAEGWREGLARSTHWRPGYSAHSLAYTWHGADGFPAAVDAVFAGSALGALEFVVGIPEYEVALPGGRRASQTDLFVLARTATGQKVALAVEGKAEEPFGDSTVAEWRREGSSGKRERLARLLEILELPDDEQIAGLRYQLFHRTASALLEASRLHAPIAVMFVHSFSPTKRWRVEFEQFVAALGSSFPQNDGLVACGSRFGRELFLGWVSDVHPEVNA